MKIFELLQKDVPTSVHRATATAFITKAVIGGRTIEFRAELQDDGAWGIVFAERQAHHDWPREGKPTFKKTGSGSALDVGAMVLSSLKEFVQRYAPETMEFSASNDTRASIYARAMAKHFPEYKVKVDGKIHRYSK